MNGAILLAALLGLPLFCVIGLLALFGSLDQGLRSGILFIDPYDKIVASPLFIAIPLFTLAGYLLSESGAPARSVRLARACLGWLPGGVALSAIATCALFTAITGASGVTIIAIGGLLLPVLLKDGYGERFSLGLVTTGGSLGLLFPPSLPIILYGMIAGVDIDALFRAGVLPGFLLMVLLGLYALRVAARSAVSRSPFDRVELGAALKASWGELPIPLLIVGGIYGGWITASEAAAVVAAWVLVIEVAVYRDIPWRRLPEIVSRAMMLVGGILLILCLAFSFTNYLVDAEVPSRILSSMSGVVEGAPSRWLQATLGLSAATAEWVLFLALVNVFLLIVGCLMDIFSAILIVVPILIPLGQRYGVDPVHLGVVFLTNLEIGYSTPPVGINLFISSLRFRRPVLELYRASLPYIALLLLALLIITYWPGLSLAFKA